MKLEGFGPLQRALVRAPDVVKDHASSAVAASVFAVVQRARALVPVATGDLRAAIDGATTGTSGRVGLVALGGPRGPFYWRFVEFGTKNMAARPFFRPAAEGEREAFIHRIRQIGPRLERDLSVSRFT
jgi:HK97 gp10 family phage protein